MPTASIQTAAAATHGGSAPTQRPTDSIRNLILSLLPQSEQAAVLARCEMVTVRSRELVFRREEPIAQVYLPEDCVISLVTEMEDGDQVEAMTVGCDGFVGM